MKSPEVLYSIEHVARELDVACVVRALLRKRYGVEVQIHVSSNAWSDDLELNGLKLLVIPSCTNRKLAHQELFERWPDLPVLNVACEQLFSPGNRRFRLPNDRFAREQVVHLAAGEFYREWLEEVNVPRDNIVTTGSMAYQMYRRPYRCHFESHRAELAAAYQLNPHIPWVFFPENFAAAFFKPSHLRKRIRGGYDARELQAYVDYTVDSFREIARWCCAAAARRDVELIVRPRPAVSADAFTRAFFEFPGTYRSANLHFIKQGSVPQWIFASELVVSSYSTTLVEAAVAGKPVGLLAPFPVPESAGSAWHSVAPRVATQAEFLNLVRGFDRISLASELQAWADYHLLNHGDAIENVARLIADITQGRRSVPNTGAPHGVSAIMKRVGDGLKQIEQVVRNRVRPNRRVLFGHECDQISQQEIDRRTEIWSAIVDKADRIHAA